MSAAPPPDPVTLAVVYRKLDTIRPYPNNARRHTAAQIAAIKRSLASFGWTSPVLVADDELVAGHARHRAATELLADGTPIPGTADGMCPVIDVSHLPPDQRRAYVIADNRLAELADWDTDLLRTELLDLANAGFDATLAGYTTPELDTILAGWTTDFTEVNRIHGNAAEQLGRLVIRCDRGQEGEIEQWIRALLSQHYPNATISAQRT